MKYFTIFLVFLTVLCCDNSQQSNIDGCTDPAACNYNPDATNDNASCLYDDCTGLCGGAYVFDDCGDCLHPVTNADIWNASCSGCTDPEAANFDIEALFDDGSCIEQFPEGWILVWNDEFSEESLNLANWNQEVWGPYHVNNELQAYTNRLENTYIEDGHLVIQALLEDYNDANYTSARLTSNNKAEWQYGRIDIRAKLPLGQGTWPAIWMLGSNIDIVGWPACGEIDIMEHVNYDTHTSSSLHSTDCFFSMETYPGTCPDYNMNCPDGCPGALPNTYWTEVGDVENWHVYGLEWTENHLTFKIDDEPYMTLHRPINSSESNWPLDQPYFLILNLAIGGDWPGDPDDSIFPVKFEIDYVRVYESAE